MNTLSHDLLKQICTIVQSNASCHHKNNHITSQCMYNIEKELKTLLNKYNIRLNQ